MTKETAIKLFEEKQVRSIWDAEQEKWYISITDVIEILTGSPRPRKYWNALKTKLKAEGSQLSQRLGQLKMQSADGKFYNTDVADTEQLFRLIQSIPSPKAEPFKLWLAQVAAERLDEMQDPELSIDRALDYFDTQHWVFGVRHWPRFGISYYHNNLSQGFRAKYFKSSKQEYSS